MSRSRAIFRSTATWAASFCPKNATSGWTISNSLLTTVATPRKCPGRDAPSSFPLSPSTSTNVFAPGGYISSTDGRKSSSTSSFSSSARSRGRSRGYLSRSSEGPNCRGLTKIDTAVAPQRDFEARTSDRCPSCKAPMVGTKPRLLPLDVSWRQAAFMSAMAAICFTAALSELAGPSLEGHFPPDHGCRQPVPLAARSVALPQARARGAADSPASTSARPSRSRHPALR